MNIFSSQFHFFEHLMFILAGEVNDILSVVRGIDSKYLDASRHVDMDRINESIPEIFELLQSNNECITEEERVKK